MRLENLFHQQFSTEIMFECLLYRGSDVPPRTVYPRLDGVKRSAPLVLRSRR